MLCFTHKEFGDAFNDGPVDAVCDVVLGDECVDDVSNRHGFIYENTTRAAVTRVGSHEKLQQKPKHYNTNDSSQSLQKTDFSMRRKKLKRAKMEEERMGIVMRFTHQNNSKSAPRIEQK